MSTRTRSRDDEMMDRAMEPPPDYGPPAVRAAQDDASQALSTITEQMGGSNVLQITAPPMLPAKVSAKVATRVAAVMAEADWVEKRGKNSFQGYAYATIDDLRSAVGRLCGKHGLAWRQDEIRAYPVGAKLLAVTYQFCLYASDEPDAEAFPSRVTVLASLTTNKGGMDDKAFSKARSLAWKDWAKSQFAIPTGDDPTPAGDVDPDRDDRREVRDERDERDNRAASPRGKLDDIAARSEQRKRIAVPKAKTPEEWASLAAETIRKVQSIGDLEALLKDEKHNLDLISEQHTALYAPIREAITEMRRTLGD